MWNTSITSREDSRPSTSSRILICEPELASALVGYLHSAYQREVRDGDVEYYDRFTPQYGMCIFKKLPPCLVGMEACATAHHWAREVMALGHEVHRTERPDT
jgi:hypothetical protein